MQRLTCNDVGTWRLGTTSGPTSFGFRTSQYRIPIGGDWTPSGDVVAICGPKSSRVTAEAIDADPALCFEPDSTGRWVIAERDGGRVFQSGMDRTPPERSDVAYVGRLPHGGGTRLVAGVHAIGSLGAIHYLAGHAAEIYAAMGDACWSAVVASIPHRRRRDHLKRARLPLAASRMTARTDTLAVTVSTATRKRDRRTNQDHAVVVDGARAVLDGATFWLP